MQFVSFFGMPFPAIPKGQTGLWLALVGLLCSSMLCAQRVDVIDQKGTKASTGVEFTESATAPSSNLEGDLWLDISSSQSVLKVYSISAAGTASWIPLSSDPALDDLSDVTITSPANNEVLSYDASSSTWVNKALKDLKNINVDISNSAYPEANPFIIGKDNFNPISRNTTSNKFVNIDDYDMYIFNNSSGNIYVVLEVLDQNYDGKIITIAEKENENPKIITEYNRSDPNGFKRHYNTTNNVNYLFIYSLQASHSSAGGSFSTEVRGESVDFIWLWNTTSNSGDWYIMR